MQIAVKTTVTVVHGAGNDHVISGHCVVPSLPVLYLLSAHPARVSAG
jgi:hypothetical protein